MKGQWLRTCSSLLPCFGSIQCSIHFEMIRVSKNSPLCPREGLTSTMSAESVSDLKFEIGHVLFMDIVGYSKLLIHEQGERQRQLNEIVRGTEQFRAAKKSGKLIRLQRGMGWPYAFLIRSSMRSRAIY
jgi:hypothetical protein